MGRRKIIVDHGECRRLAKMFDVSVITVTAALSFVTKSALANSIRTAAKQRGGVEVDRDATSPREFDTRWTEVPRCMIQEISPRIWLRVYVDEDRVVIEEDGREVDSCDAARFSDIAAMQTKAQLIADKGK